MEIDGGLIAGCDQGGGDLPAMPGASGFCDGDCGGW